MIGLMANIPKLKLAAVMKILNSKRLLSDHCEVLEECLLEIDESFQTRTVGKYFTGTNCSLMMTLLLVAKNWLNRGLGITLCVLSSGYTIAYISKILVNRHLSSLQEKIQILLNEIDRFDTCTRRNITYFRENALFQSSQSTSVGKISPPIELITFTKSLMLVIESIANVVKSFETVHAPKNIENMFGPLEDLSKCEFFQKPHNESSVSHLKDAYNVFLYVQSHLLTRISLFLIYNSDDSLHLPYKECASLSQIMRTEIINDNLRYQHLTSNQSNKNSISHTIDHVSMEPVSNLKNYSLSMSSRMFAIANQCRHIDDMIQTVDSLDKDELIQLMPSIEQIENSMSVCQNDYQRFVVAYHKFMYVKYDVRCPESSAVDIEHEFAADCPILNLKDIKQIEDEEEEFFTSTERTEDDGIKVRKNRECWDDELTTRNFNLVKQRFKPVLAQLKGKIEPIALSLRERERNHLLAKGIDPSEFVDCNNISKGVESGSDSDEVEIERVKPKRNNEHYDEMRKFLERKPPISLIPMKSTNESFLNEDILE